jgi:hypothetical protein
MLNIYTNITKKKKKIRQTEDPFAKQIYMYQTMVNTYKYNLQWRI